VQLVFVLLLVKLLILVLPHVNVLLLIRLPRIGRGSSTRGTTSARDCGRRGRASHCCLNGHKGLHLGDQLLLLLLVVGVVRHADTLLLLLLSVSRVGALRRRQPVNRSRAGAHTYTHSAAASGSDERCVDVRWCAEAMWAQHLPVRLPPNSAQLTSAGEHS
jgi:hypothetical protein